MKALCLGTPALFTVLPAAVKSWAFTETIEEVETPLPDRTFIVKYMEAGFNHCLNPRGIYVSRLEFVLDVFSFDSLVRGIATKGAKAKYFSVMVEDSAMRHYKIRLALVKETSTNILNSFRGIR